MNQGLCILKNTNFCWSLISKKWSQKYQNTKCTLNATSHEKKIKKISLLSFSSLKKFKKKTKILIFKTIPFHWRWKELKLELFRGSGRIVSNDDIWWDEDSVLPSHQHQFVFFSSSSFEICCLSVGTPQILLFLKNKKKNKNINQ